MSLAPLPGQYLSRSHIVNDGRLSSVVYLRKYLPPAKIWAIDVVLMQTRADRLSPAYREKGYGQALREQAVKLYGDGMNYRRIERTLG